MSGFGCSALQKAVYDALAVDATLASLINGIFDDVPQGTSYPYIVIDVLQASDWSGAGYNGQEIACNLDIFSRKKGKKETIAIMERVYTLLHNTGLTAAGFQIITMRMESASVALENDGSTYHGAMLFRALIRT